VRRARNGRITGFGENQALVAVLSTQLWHREFFHRSAASATPGLQQTLASDERTAIAAPSD
jgi:hypothetical protein